MAKTYWRKGGKLLTAYLDIQNPYVDTTRKTYYNKDKNDYTDDIVRKAKKEGYDSVIFKDIEDIGSNAKYAIKIKDNYKSNDYIVFKKEQIKIVEEDGKYGI